MIKIYVQSTHFKVYYDEATEKERLHSENILNNKFKAEDKSLRFDPRVKRGIMSPVTNFYNPENSILPSGFLKYLIAYFNIEKLEYKIIDLRKFPGVNKEFAKQLLKKKVNINGFKPRQYQIEACLTVVKEKGGIIQLPTGSGKGFIVALLCNLYSKSKILCLFDSIDLIDQTRRNLVEKYEIPESEVGVIQGVNRQLNRRITLLSVQSYEKAFSIFNGAKVIIADECHKTGRNETSQKIIYSCQNAAIHIGLSATADCIDNPIEQMRLFGNIGPITYIQELADHIENNYLAKIEVELYTIDSRPLPVSGSWTDRYNEEKELEALGDESTHYVFNEERNRKIAEIAKSHDRVLILYTRKDHGAGLQALIDGSYLISGSDRIDVRNAAEAYLKKNKKACVISSNIWATGKDIPEIETFINASGGISQVHQIQKMGRATRLNPDTDKQTAKVVDFLDRFSPLAIKQSNKRQRTYEKLNLPIVIK